jgi:hypothetical protein
MPSPRGSNDSYVLDFSDVVAERLKALQRQASRRGSGQAFRTAFREIFRRLRRNPTATGELLYHLPALRLEIRTVVVAPLVIDFAVSVDHAMVYIRSGKLLSPG